MRYVYFLWLLCLTAPPAVAQNSRAATAASEPGSFDSERAEQETSPNDALGGQTVSQLVRIASQWDGDWDRRHAAYQRLWTMRSSAKTGASELIAILKTDAYHIVRTAYHSDLLQLLERLDPEAVRRYAEELIDDLRRAEDPEQRRMAAIVVAMIPRWDAVNHDVKSKVVPALMAALRDSDARVCGAAASALTTDLYASKVAAYKPTANELISAFNALLTDPDHGRRFTGAWSLTKIGHADAAAVRVLIEATRAPSLRLSAVEALGKIGPAAEAASPDLIRILREDKEDIVRWHAATALGKIKSDSEAVRSALVAALTDPHELVRENATKALGNYGLAAEFAVPNLLERLHDQKWLVREAAVKAIAMVCPAPDAVGHLLDPILDPNVEVRATALMALRKVGTDERAIPTLVTCLQRYPNNNYAVICLLSLGPEGRRAAIDALKDYRSLTLFSNLDDASLLALLSILPDLPNLQNVEFVSERVTDEWMPHLASVKNQRKLDLLFSKVTDAGLVHLEKLVNLEELRLSDYTSDAGLSHVVGLRHLKRLVVYAKKVTDEGMKHIAELSNLEDLSVDGSVSDEGLKSLLGLKRLRRLSVGGQMTPEGMKYVTQLSKLEELDLERSVLSDAALKDLPALTSLKSLDLSFGRHQVTDEGMKYVARLPELRRLNISWTGVTDAGLEYLTQLPKLEILYVEQTRITRDGVARVFDRFPKGIKIYGITQYRDTFGEPGPGERRWQHTQPVGPKD